MRELKEPARAMGVSLSDAQLDRFEVYCRELLAWNRKFNLTAITDRYGVMTRHFLDSLSCLLAVPRLAGRVIDVGTGAGFPGLPLKIARPHIQLTLVEATGKKVAFLRHLVGELGLENVTILHNRIETVGRDPDHREQYRLAVARAVAELRVLAEYMLPLLRPGGMMLAQKGTDPAAEVAAAARALQVLGGEHRQTMPVAIPGLPAARHLVLIQKNRPTPATYPRRAGVPTRKPLG